MATKIWPRKFASGQAKLECQRQTSDCLLFAARSANNGRFRLASWPTDERKWPRAQLATSGCSLTISRLRFVFALLRSNSIQFFCFFEIRFLRAKVRGDESGNGSASSICTNCMANDVLVVVLAKFSVYTASLRANGGQLASERSQKDARSPLWP